MKIVIDGVEFGVIDQPAFTINSDKNAETNLTIKDLIKLKESLPKIKGGVQAIVGSPALRQRILNTLSDRSNHPMPFGYGTMLGLKVHSLIEMADYEMAMTFQKDQDAIDFINRVKFERQNDMAHTVIEMYFTRAKGVKK